MAFIVAIAPVVSVGSVARQTWERGREKWEERREKGETGSRETIAGTINER